MHRSIAVANLYKTMVRQPRGAWFCLKVLPFPQAYLLAIMLKLDGSPRLSDGLRSVHELLLIDLPVGVLEGLGLPLLGRHKVQFLEHIW